MRGIIVFDVKKEEIAFFRIIARSVRFTLEIADHFEQASQQEGSF